MKELLKAAGITAALMISIIGVVLLGIWINSGSLIGLTIAMILLWLLATALFYWTRDV